MRKLIVVNIVSLDGYFEGPGHDVMALPFDEAFDEYNVERLREAGTLVLGRNTYLGFKGYWPPVADKPDVRPVEREISRLNNAIEKVVVSDSLTEDDLDPWGDTTRIVGHAVAADQIALLKAEPGKDLLVFGSHTTWNALFVAGVVDEVHLMIGPAFLGAGTPVFEGTRHPLRLLESRVLPDSQLVLAKYSSTLG
jgi:dihydrofolate reductase